MLIGGEIIVLKKASYMTGLKLRNNRFMNALESLLVLKENIDQTKDNELANKEKIKGKTKKSNKRI